MTEKTLRNAEKTVSIGEVVLSGVGLVIKIAGLVRGRKV